MSAMYPPLLEQWAKTWRAPMLRFALLHIQPREEAEDAVQDALTALLEVSETTLRAAADPRRYLFGILKHKITDRLRRKYRSELRYEDAFSDDLDNVLFEPSGHWVSELAPSIWQQPDSQLQTDQFFAVVDICMNRLPAKPARVFSMKAFLECDAEEICSTLGLSKADYWQCMSRARKQIQMCLTQNWFDGVAP
jgi:RNA polymerase sigma-70 factor (ECF subfamily)